VVIKFISFDEFWRVEDVLSVLLAVGERERLAVGKTDDGGEERDRVDLDDVHVEVVVHEPAGVELLDRLD